MNITFNNPSFLWLLLSIPLLALTHFILLKHIKRRAMKFVNFQAMKRVAGITLLTKNIPLLILRLFALLLLIFAVSGTTLWYYGETNQNDFVLAIDTSASMTTTDFEPSRLEAAKESAIGFVDSMTSKTEIGLVSFSGTTFIEQLPTSDLYKVKQKINEIDIMISGGTDLSSAIITSTNMLLTSRRGKTIILLTDGSNTAGPFVDDGIDSGDIIVQEKFKVTKKDTFNSLVKKNYKIASDAMLKALDLLEKGNYKLIQNNDKFATYNSTPSLKDALKYRIKRIINYL